MRDRIADIYSDYQRMCDVDCMFVRFPFDHYLHLRLLIGRSPSSSRLTLVVTSAVSTEATTTVTWFLSPTC